MPIPSQNENYIRRGKLWFPNVKTKTKTDSSFAWKCHNFIKQHKILLVSFSPLGLWHKKPRFRLCSGKLPTGVRSRKSLVFYDASRISLAILPSTSPYFGPFLCQMGILEFVPCQKRRGCRVSTTRQWKYLHTSPWVSLSASHDLYTNDIVLCFYFLVHFLEVFSLNFSSIAFNTCVLQSVLLKYG